MVVVRARAHLGHDCWTLIYVVWYIERVAEVLHAADAVEDVVLGVDAPSHVSLVGHDALAGGIAGKLADNGSAWAMVRKSRARTMARLVETFLDGLIPNWPNLGRCHVLEIVCVLLGIAREIPLLIHKLLLLLHDRAFSLRNIRRTVRLSHVSAVMLVDQHRLMSVVVVLRLARVNVVAISGARHHFLYAVVLWHPVFAAHLAEADLTAQAVLTTDVAPARKLHLRVVHEVIRGSVACTSAGSTQVAGGARLAEL